MKLKTLIAAACLVGLAGCQSTDQQLDAQQQQAVDTALQRVKFDMNCPTATGQVLSRQMIQPVSIPLRRRARRVHGGHRRLRPAPDDRRRCVRRMAAAALPGDPGSKTGVGSRRCTPAPDLRQKWNVTPIAAPEKFRSSIDFPGRHVVVEVAPHRRPGRPSRTRSRRRGCPARSGRNHRYRHPGSTGRTISCRRRTRPGPSRRRSRPRCVAGFASAFTPRERQRP